MDFLPQDYETPQGGGSYMKLQQGENKFRILSKPIIGWLDWKDKTPHRFTMKNKPEKPFDPSKPIRHFWAMLVFDYADKSIKILEITQNTIQKAIEHLAKDEDWGNPADYDIKVTKSGVEKATEYKVNPSPKKSLSDEIKEAAKAKPVNLEALYKGGDPFNIQNGEQTQLIFESLPF
jgi:hypothetical protein